MQLKWKLIAINLSVVLAVLTTISACGKKEEGDAPAPGPAPIVQPNPVVDDDDDDNSPINTAQEISGTYTGTLFTHGSTNRGQATVTVSANNLLDISVTISHPQMAGVISFVAYFYGFDGFYLDYLSLTQYSLYSMTAGEISNRRVLASGVYIYNSGNGSPQMFLQFQAVHYDYDEFGPWDIFYWQTYWVEYPNWMTISNLVKTPSL